MDLGDWVALLNTGWTLYQIYKECREKAEIKSLKHKGKRRKCKPKSKRRK